MIYTVIHKYANLDARSFRNTVDAAKYLAAQANTNSFVLISLDIDEDTGETRSILTSEVPRYATVQNILQNIDVDCAT
jgi:hypothetical protein